MRPSTPVSEKIGANTTAMITVENNTGWRTCTEVSNTTCSGDWGVRLAWLRRRPR
jgi:hypothetical protein